MSTTMNGNIEEMMTDYEKQGLLHEMFLRQAQKTPNKVQTSVECRNDKIKPFQQKIQKLSHDVQNVK